MENRRRAMTTPSGRQSARHGSPIAEATGKLASAEGRKPNRGEQLAQMKKRLHRDKRGNDQLLAWKFKEPSRTLPGEGVRAGRSDRHGKGNSPPKVLLAEILSQNFPRA